jgi:anti-sigma B factor antagonist
VALICTEGSFYTTNPEFFLQNPFSPGELDHKDLCPLPSFEGVTDDPGGYYHVRCSRCGRASCPCATSSSFVAAHEGERISMPSLKVTPREIGSVIILDLSGPIALGESSTLFGKAIRQLTSNDQTKILLNLRDVSSIDSAGIGELVRAYILVKTKTGEMKLLNPTKKVHDLLDLTRLLGVMEVFTDEAVALGSFG